jgi:CO/xanthine dehydrogenase Mo-binding subunit
MQDSGTAVLHAAAQVREILIGEAARRLGVASSELRAERGAVLARDGRSLGYGALVGDQVLHVRAQAQSALKPFAAHAVMGRPVQRVDIPGKVTGGASYVHDLRLPGMVHARVVRPPGYDARLEAVDIGPAEKMPGVLKVVRDGSFLAVIAVREWQAIRAMKALRSLARWSGQRKLPDERALYPVLASLPTEDTVIAGGSAAPEMRSTVVEASYKRPYQMHGAIGPSCAVAQYSNGKMTVWTHSQGAYPVRDAIAELLRMPPDSVHCIHMEGSGCYGHNGADDAAGDAALVARAFAERPVRVQWMREDEHAWEPYGPAMRTRVRAALDATGTIAAWDYEVWSNTHSMRPGAAGNLAAAADIASPFAPEKPKPLAQPEGGGDRNAIPIYRIPGMRVTHHFIPQMPLRVSALRALGAYANIFSIESFMDELALAAKADPVAFRLRHIEDPRAQQVVRLAAERFGWTSFRRQRGRGRGFAFARYKNLAAYLAVAMEVEFERDSGILRILRVHAAIDSGEVVNPDGIRNQVEGGVVQSISWTMLEAVRFDTTRITSRDWGGYPILRLSQVPRSLDVHIVDRPGEPFLGTGEAAQGPAAAALANALADATGARMRELPVSPARLRAAYE